MSASYYFYDLETSGLNARTDRIMQFAGQRTDRDFQPLGEPQNILIKLADDTLPNPTAIMVTGITPQATLQDGMSEQEFCQYFMSEIATPQTTIMGYNSVRFDDEFMRHLLWRNFYDPYGWQWQDGRSRWDLLDVVRLTRALRPEGIKWPTTADGHSTNRLELITKLNGIEHAHAHDALADVVALIEVAKLLRQHQPQMFEFLYKLRNKREVAALVNPAQPRPFVYASGRYSSEFEKTTVAYPVAPAENGAVWVYDLRYNLDDLLAKETAARQAERSRLAEQKLSLGKAEQAKSAGSTDKGSSQKSWREREPWEKDYFPILKKLQYNRCPAVAPLGVLEKANGWEKLKLNQKIVEQNLQSLLKHPEFVARITSKERPEFPPAADAESALYDGFLDDQDRVLCAAVRNNGATELTNFCPNFADERLTDLLLHYKARNYPESLSTDETEKWEQYRAKRLERQAKGFIADLQKLNAQFAKGHTMGKSLDECNYLAEELMLWYQAIMPVAE